MFNIYIEQASFLNQMDEEDTNLTDAIYSIYSGECDFVFFIIWNDRKIRIFGSSFSQIYNDVILMLEELEFNGVFSASFLDSGFTAKWYISVNNNIIKIKSEWYTIVLCDENFNSDENIQEIPDTIEVDKNIFINEWNKLLKVVKKDLLRAGYSDNLDGFEYLNNLN